MSNWYDKVKDVLGDKVARQLDRQGWKCKTVAECFAEIEQARKQVRKAERSAVAYLAYIAHLYEKAELMRSWENSQ